MALSIHDTFIGTTQSLSGYERGGYASPSVRVSYKDENGNRQIVTICAYGARVLAKALNKNADLIDPPKPKRRRQ